MKSTKKLNEREISLISYLVQKANIYLQPKWLENVMVMPLDDGGMGSLMFVSPHHQERRKCKALIADCKFKDKDGVPVIASLYTDEKDELYELDIWKADFSPLIEIPFHYSSIKENL